MKPRFHLAAAILFIFLIPMVTALPAAAAIIKIMPLGDSITSGIDGSTDDTGYRLDLYLNLTGAGYSSEDLDFVGSLAAGIGTPPDFPRNHEGHGGWSANQIRDNVYNWLNNNPADIVLLHIGTNDITAEQPPAGIVAEVIGTLDEIDRFNTDTWVIIARIINRTSSSQATADFNILVEAMVQDRINLGDKLILVDMENGAGIVYILQPDGDMDDPVHPFDTGYKKMADLWLVGLQQGILPVADAGSDQSVDEFDLVTLDGTGSIDPKGGNLSFQWVQTGGPDVDLIGDQSATPTFTAPDVAPGVARLLFRLTVTDQNDWQSVDLVRVDVNNPASTGGGGGGGGGCFIATAAYGSAMKPHAKMLREFRDRFLLTNSHGRAFVELYCTLSPPLADFFAKHNNVRAIVRVSLAPLVGISWLALSFGPSVTLTLIALTVFLVVVSSTIVTKRLRS